MKYSICRTSSETTRKREIRLPIYNRCGFQIKEKLIWILFLYLYLHTFKISRGQAHAHSIYPMHPYPYFKGNPKTLQASTDVGYSDKVLL